MRQRNALSGSASLQRRQGREEVAIWVASRAGDAASLRCEQGGVKCQGIAVMVACLL